MIVSSINNNQILNNNTDVPKTISKRKIQCLRNPNKYYFQFNVLFYKSVKININK